MAITREAAENLSQSLRALCEEMTTTLQDMVPSQTLREKILRPGAAICDPQGRVVAASSILHLGPLGYAARKLITDNRYPVEGDCVVVFNDPFSGSTRVQDFYALRMVDMPGCTQPWMLISCGTGSDIGGERFGSYDPKASEIWAEGVRITPVILFQNDEIVRDTMVCTVLNSRTPRLLEALLRGLIDSVNQGAVNFVKLAESQSLDESPPALLAMGESSARNLLEGLTPKNEEVSVHLAYQNSVLPAEVRLKACLDGGQFQLDFSESTVQIPGYFNATRGVTLSAVLGQLYNSYEELPINDGLLAPLDILTKPGTIVEASYPVATSFGPVSTGLAIAVTLQLALDLDSAPPITIESLIGLDGELDKQIADRLREDENKQEPFPLPKTEI